MRIAFTIPGRIGGKGRPRFAGHAYTDRKTLAGERTVGTYANQAMRGKAPLTGPLAFIIEMWLQPPVSWSKKRRDAAYWVTGKPDCDNVLKLLTDAMNKIVYEDDSQIADVQLVRRYTKGQEEVCVYVHTLTEECTNIKQQDAA